MGDCVCCYLQRSGVLRLGISMMKEYTQYYYANPSTVSDPNDGRKLTSTLSGKFFRMCFFRRQQQTVILVGPSFPRKRESIRNSR